jgi:alkylation response protein AidB-like acyl-CoA dehydrogenase
LIRDRLIKLEGAVQAHVCSGYYQLTRDAHNKDSGLLSMMNKMIITDIGHEVAAIANDIIGTDGLLMPGEAAVSFGEKKGAKVGNEKWMNQILSSLAMAMGGGTSNIQRNIIATRGLDLPRSD